MRTTFRSAQTPDAEFLREMLERAFNWREHAEFDTALLQEPHVAHYADPWRTGDDVGVVAELEGRPVGAAWVRHLTGADPGYGYVRDGVPELTMAVARGFGGQGIGSGLLGRLLDAARTAGIDGVSLSVEDGNRARGLYERFGFTVVGREGNSDTMLVTLR